MSSEPDRTGQIGLVPGAHTLFEWVIRAVTRSTTHHAVLAISPTLCLSAEPGGARIRSINSYPDAYWSRFDLNLAEAHDIHLFAVHHLGAPYGLLTDLAIGVSLLAKLRTPIFVQRYLESDSHFECAQLCDSAYNAAGIHLFSGRVASSVYPGLFEQIWRRRGWMPPEY